MEDHTATENHMPTPGNSDFPAFTPAKTGIRFSAPRGMQGWVNLELTAIYKNKIIKLFVGLYMC